MRTDATISFLPIGSNLSMVGATGATFYSNIIDLIGAGSGTAPANIIGSTTTFGTDLGIGGVKVQMDIATGTAFATGGTATLNVQMQGAPDTGSAGGYLPGTWQTLVESGTLTAAQLTAQTVIARFDWPPAFPANLRPRFMRLAFVTPSGQSFTAGTIAFAIPTMVRDDYAAKYQPSNFVVH